MILAFVFISLGTLITVFNFALSFVAHPLHHLFNRNQPFQSASGIPLIGSILLWFGATILLWFGETTYSIAAFVISLFDTGAIHFDLVMLGYEYLKEWRNDDET